MAVIKKTYEVSKEADELAGALVKMITAIKDALADGWQPGTDVPVIIAQALTVLVPAIDGISQLDDEIEENLGAFVRAFGIAAIDLTTIFLEEKKLAVKVDDGEG